MTSKRSGTSRRDRRVRATNEGLLEERSKPRVGSLERLVAQVLFELQDFGFIDELADIPEEKRGDRFDQWWQKFAELIRSDVLGAARLEVKARAKLRVEKTAIREPMK